MTVYIGEPKQQPKLIEKIQIKYEIKTLKLECKCEVYNFRAWILKEYLFFNFRNSPKHMFDRISTQKSKTKSMLAEDQSWHLDFITI